MDGRATVFIFGQRGGMCGTQVLGCLPALDQAVQEGDANATQLAAHTFKGTSASLACKTLSLLCRELEMMARAENLTDAPQQLQKIRDEYGRVQLALINHAETAV